MNNLDKTYTALLQDILDNGVEKKDRTGTGTLSVFGRQIRHKMSEGFPLLTTKKMGWKQIVTELLWFLRGDTNIKFLVDNNCHIWDGDAYKNYITHNQFNSNPKWLKPVLLDNGHSGATLYTQEEFINKIKTDDDFAKTWGELGPIYGKQWRSWEYGELVSYMGEIPSRKSVDQIKEALEKLKTNPDDRGIIVSAWNVGELDEMILRPCHNFFQFYTRELSLQERGFIAGSNHYEVSLNIKFFTKVDEDEQLHKQLDDINIPRRAISLMWNQRSVDTGLGLGFNIASYGLLLEMIAKQVNMIPDELIGNLGDVHLYLDHVEPIKEQLNRKPFELPTLKIYSNIDDISHYKVSDFELIGYQYHPTIKLPLSN